MKALNDNLHKQVQESEIVAKIAAGCITLSTPSRLYLAQISHSLDFSVTAEHLTNHQDVVNIMMDDHR